MLCLFFFFFFKQKTAYEMRISDWSSDVCSSDLFKCLCKTHPKIGGKPFLNETIDAGSGDRIRHDQASRLSHFLDNGALKQGIRTTAQLFQIEQACGKKRCACSKADIPFFPDRSHTSHAGKNHSSYPGFQLTQCLSDRRL